MGTINNIGAQRLAASTGQISPPRRRRPGRPAVLNALRHQRGRSGRPAVPGRAGARCAQRLAASTGQISSRPNIRRSRVRRCSTPCGINGADQALALRRDGGALPVLNALRHQRGRSATSARTRPAAAGPVLNALRHQRGRSAGTLRLRRHSSSGAQRLAASTGQIRASGPGVGTWPYSAQRLAASTGQIRAPASAAPSF